MPISTNLTKLTFAMLVHDDIIVFIPASRTITISSCIKITKMAAIARVKAIVMAI